MEDLLAADVTATYTAHYISREKCITVLNPLVPDSFDLIPDIACHALAFLPSSSPQKVLLIVREDDGARSFYLWPIDRSLPDLPAFDSCLRVSPYPPDLLFGYIADGVLLVYEIAADGANPAAHCVRIFHDAGPPFQWFDFVRGVAPSAPAAKERAPDPQIVAVFGADGKLSLQCYSLVSAHAYAAVEIGTDFIDAAVSPANPSRVAVLRSESVAIYDGVEKGGEELWEIPLPGYASGARRVFWSPFGSRIKIAFAQGDRGRPPVATFVEVAPRNWKMEDDG
jgi:hypothetical protein